MGKGSASQSEKFIKIAIWICTIKFKNDRSARIICRGDYSDNTSISI